MNGMLAQIISIACHGNAFLQGFEIGDIFPCHPNFQRDHSAFKHCQCVEFAFLEPSPTGGTLLRKIADSPQHWFEWLKTSGAQGIRVSRMPQNNPHASDRMLAGFIGGGGTWLLEIVYPQNTSDFWAAKWESNLVVSTPWSVTYARILQTQQPPIEPQNLEQSLIRFTQAVREIHAFSKCIQGAEAFARLFTESLQTLETGGTDYGFYYRDMAPAGFLPRTAAMLLKACQQAWVFGAMGSWNDTWFIDDSNRAEYDRVSENLFVCLTETITAAANQSFYQHAR